MKVYTIEKKMSGTGTIHDIASEHYNREIKFLDGARFAVVLSSYYGGRGYTTHKTAEAAAKMSDRQARNGYSHVVIDYRGNTYTSNGGTLLAD
jgi:hypothetical protein